MRYITTLGKGIAITHLARAWDMSKIKEASGLAFVHKDTHCYGMAKCIRLHDRYLTSCVMIVFVTNFHRCL